jgi:hypothetical protein
MQPVELASEKTKFGNGKAFPLVVSNPPEW